MAGRKADLYDERRQQIIDGALEVFSTKGFIAATNKDIAEAANINSAGLIYHYFDSKEDLLKAVIEHYAPPMQVLAEADSFMALAPKEALTQFGTAYLKMMEDTKISACMRILIGEALRSPDFGEIIGRVGPLRIWTLTADYIQCKIDEGLLRKADPSIASRCFLGPLITYVLTQKIFRTPEHLNPSELVSTCVDVFLRGLEV